MIHAGDIQLLPFVFFINLVIVLLRFLLEIDFKSNPYFIKYFITNK